jgi:starvation-inducible outer membrane lipoprotein
MKTLAILLLLLLSACTSTPHFVAASRATYDAIAPEYLAYIEDDASLAEASKQIRRNTMARWREAIEAEEQAVRK